MSDEVSSDVGYLINQLNEISNNENSLKITYNDQVINGENRLTKEEAQNEPIVQTKNQSHAKTLVMIDPDAPSSDQPITGPFLHWIKANFKESDTSDGETICDYMGPGPRAGTGRHRYIFLLYQSDKKVKDDRTFEDIPKRRKFTLEKFVAENELQLIGLTLFTVDA